MTSRTSIGNSERREIIGDVPGSGKKAIPNLSGRQARKYGYREFATPVNPPREIVDDLSGAVRLVAQCGCR